MMLSVELSHYPFAQDYKTVVNQLIDHLQQTELDVEIRPNSMSTHLFGDYQEVMELLGEAMKWSFETHGKAAFVAKFIEGDRR